MTTENNAGGEKLYAGKFKSVEELENGYKSSAVIFDENEALKKKLNDATSIPSDYINPADVALDDNRVTELKARAKEAGMTQTQYEKFVRSDKARVDQYTESFENAKKEVGEPTINMLKDYISKQYPAELGDSMLKTFIGNKTARDAALKHRETLLNSQTPGVGKMSGGGYNVTDEDVQKAYAEKEKNPHNLKARQHYLNLLAAKAS